MLEEDFILDDAPIDPKTEKRLRLNRILAISSVAMAVVSSGMAPISLDRVGPSFSIFWFMLNVIGIGGVSFLLGLLFALIPAQGLSFSQRYIRASIAILFAL